MNDRTMLKTNFIVCSIIVIGFIITSVISYYSNVGIFQKDAEHVSVLASDGIYNKIDSIFLQPINVALTMANDSLLQDFLLSEKDNLEEQKYLLAMQNYLKTYQKKYAYDSVFLVSTETHRYYHFNGLDRVLTKDNPENVWYYEFLENDEEYSLYIDNDEARDDHITIFINCKIKDVDGKVLAIVGVGFQVNSLQTLFAAYEEQYGVQAYLVDSAGVIQVSVDKTGYEGINLFENPIYTDKTDLILENKEARQTFWYYIAKSEGYVVTLYEPNLHWYLIIRNDTSAINKKLDKQFYCGISVITIILVLVLFIITAVIKKYNLQIVKLTVSQELEYQYLLRETTEDLYENIFEFDITRQRAVGEVTREYFRSLGISPDTAYHEALQVIATKQIKEEYIQGYLDLFMPDCVLETYHHGISNLSYDFMMYQDENTYHWMRITARLFFWNSDQSIRMITYRKDMNEEKQKELLFLEKSQKDFMTGLYNKNASEELITKVLARDITTIAHHAFFILDIDNFKTVNDTKGHAFGDHVITEFAAVVAAQFRENDIVGRIGGDEFIVLMNNFDDIDVLRQKLTRLCGIFGNKDFGESSSYYISCSIGVALYPIHGVTYLELFEKADQSLYYAKGHGKDSFCIFGENPDNAACYVNQRDIEGLLNVATDGMAKIAFMEQWQLLYFNQNYSELLGIPLSVLSAPDFDVLAQIHPDDRARVISNLEKVVLNKHLFALEFRMQYSHGDYFNVNMKGTFTGELYRNQYPVFYVMYTKV